MFLNIFSFNINFIRFTEDLSFKNLQKVVIISQAHPQCVYSVTYFSLSRIPHTQYKQKATAGLSLLVTETQIHIKKTGF